jgi:hypothetical protein
LAKYELRRISSELMKNFFLVICFCCLAFKATAQGEEIYVVDTGNFSAGPFQILKYNDDGTNPALVTNTNLSQPQDIFFLEDKNIMLVSNLLSGSITSYNAETGAYIGIFAQGIGGPTRMKLGPDNLLYVLQWQGNGTVRRYQLDDTYLGEFTTVGVNQSIGLDWDQAGNLYVSSFADRTVRKFDSNGVDQGLFINSGLSGPTNIWFEANGDMLVADWSGGFVRRFDSNGNFLSNYIGGLSQAEGIGYLANGNLLIGNGGTSAVKMYDSSGAFISDVVSSGSGGLLKPNAVIVRKIPSMFKINAGLNDAWVSAGAPLQGMFVTVFPDLNLVFVAWFTFDSVVPIGGSPAVFGANDQRWVTGVGTIDGNTAEIKMELTSGGSFNSSVPTPVQDTNYGTLVLVFENCSSGIATFNFPGVGQAGEFMINRVLESNVPLCEQLQVQ